ncbi:hypothetical protein WKW79_28915 [Variovorax robiniae]|uniref:Uncharacterized protein n=1 Tax=Variovorax robiniae TaxID=1836199 RepID=A0ABU8XFI0_9BURK
MRQPGTEALHQAVLDAVGALFDATGTAAFCLPIPGTTPPVFVAAGEPGTIRLLLPDSANDRYV